MWAVFETRKCLKQVRKCPKDVLKQYEAWKAIVTTSGPRALRAIPGYRDHALKGEWKGARSSYLTKQWRVIYVAQKHELQVAVLEVNPHEY